MSGRSTGRNRGRYNNRDGQTVRQADSTRRYSTVCSCCRQILETNRLIDWVAHGEGGKAEKKDGPTHKWTTGEPDEEIPTDGQPLSQTTSGKDRQSSSDILIGSCQAAKQS